MQIKSTLVTQQAKEHITWSQSYSVGIKMIDDQHKGLLNIVNDLFNHASGNEKEEEAYFKVVIQHAVQYVKEHFQVEEKLMLAAKYPSYAEHKKVHEAFTLTVLKSVKDFESGKRLVLEKFAYYLKDWILTHIAIMDMRYAQYFKKIATRKANGKLSVSRSDIPGT